MFECLTFEKDGFLETGQWMFETTVYLYFEHWGLDFTTFKNVNILRQEIFYSLLMMFEELFFICLTSFLYLKGDQIQLIEMFRNVLQVLSKELFLM